MRRVNVHQIFHISHDPEDPDGVLATPAEGPIQLAWDAATPEEVILILGDGEFSLSRDRFFSEEDFPEGAVSSVMHSGNRMIFKVPADEPGYAHLLMSERAEEIKAWVWQTYLDETPGPDLDAELARLLEGTL